MDLAGQLTCKCLVFLPLKNTTVDVCTRNPIITLTSSSNHTTAITTEQWIWQVQLTSKCLVLLHNY